MAVPTRISAATMTLLIAGAAPAFAELSPQPATVQTSIATPTTTLNKGQTDIATSLAKAQLAQYGITHPTPQQLNAALNGGTITAGTGTGSKTVQLKGVLTQRAAGQGWGQIANGMGLKLGKVVSEAKSGHHEAMDIEDREYSKYKTKSSGSGEHHALKENKHITQAGVDVKHHAKESYKHITTAGGASGAVYSREHGKSHDHLTTAGGKSESGYREHGKRYGAGIVTAAGGSYTSPHHQSHHQERGAGIVTASSAGSGGTWHGRSEDGGGHGKSGK